MIWYIYVVGEQICLKVKKSIFISELQIQIHRNLTDYLTHKILHHYGTRSTNGLIRNRIKTDL